MIDTSNQLDAVRHEGVSSSLAASSRAVTLQEFLL